MNNGSAITGHTTYSANGAVCVTGANARFIMNGGQINGNHASNSVTNASGGVYVTLSAQFTMNGGTISGNMAGLGTGIPLDVYFEPSAGATLSGSAAVGVVKLDINAAATANSSLTLDNWTPPGSTTLHLRGGNAVMVTAIYNWVGKEVLKAASSYTLTLADIAKFTLGNFYTTNDGSAGQAIADTHELRLESGAVVLRAK